MGIQEVLVCDKCGSQNSTVQRIQLITVDGRASFDLCQRCRKPLTEILHLLAKAPVRRVGRPSGLVKTVAGRVYDDPAAIPGKRSNKNRAGKPTPMNKQYTK